MEQSTIAKDSNALMLECIDRSLKAYCAGLPQVIYLKFEQMERFPKDQIPNRLEGFIEVIDSVFGESGVTLKRSIVREIRSNSDLENADKIADLVSCLVGSRITVSKGENA